MTSLRSTLFSQLFLCALLGVTNVHGKPPSAVVGGTLAGDNEFPYIAGLTVFNQHVCGGAILDSTHIITAAHCVDIKGVDLIKHMVVVTGTNDIHQGNRYHVKSIKKHAKYSESNKWTNDIAMITLRTAIKFNKREKAVKLPSKNTPENVLATASGWGDLSHPKGVTPSKLWKLDMNVLSNKKCVVPMTVIRDVHLCAFAKKGSGLCTGDSGGPLVSNGELVGLAAFVIPCARGYPDVFTRVYSYLDWIHDAMKN